MRRVERENWLPDACHIMFGAKEQRQSQSVFTRTIVCILLAVISAPGLVRRRFCLKVTEKNYLDTRGLSVFLYDSNVPSHFCGPKNTAMAMILRAAHRH